MCFMSEVIAFRCVLFSFCVDKRFSSKARNGPSSSTCWRIVPARDTKGVGRQVVELCVWGWVKRRNYVLIISALECWMSHLYVKLDSLITTIKLCLNHITVISTYQFSLHPSSLLACNFIFLWVTHTTQTKNHLSQNRVTRGPDSRRIIQSPRSLTKIWL